MKIGLIHSSVVPVQKYGGTERVVWWLGKELSRQGHEITLIAPKGSSCSFGRYITYNPETSIDNQIPDDLDIVHLHFVTHETIRKKPYLISCHGNGRAGESFDINTVFVSGNHASRHGAEAFVYNGIDTAEYGKPLLNNRRKHLLFLANASWRIKNLQGAIKIARRAKIPLTVIGGNRLNLKMGFRFTLDSHVLFKGQLGGNEKLRVIQESKALLFPVLWDEPFGLAIIESMYFGCPVFGTPWGSLPELVPPDMGFLSTSYAEHSDKLSELGRFKPELIHEHVCENFTVKQMTAKYLRYYEQVLNGKNLNSNLPGVNQFKEPVYYNMNP